jgi:microcystin-dependent protein
MKSAPAVLLAASVLVASFSFGFRSPPQVAGGAADPFIGEIMLFGGNFAPEGWAFCDGQFLPIAQNQALFSILGTTYGGDGEQTFRLPDLRGRVPMHPGNGPGLPPVELGETGGARTVTLTTAQMPNHDHALMGHSGLGGGAMPLDKTMASTKAGRIYGAPADMPMAADAITSSGGGQAHENTPPYQAVNYCIALIGVFPSRS